METTHRSKFILSSNLLFVTTGLIIISGVITRMFIPDESNSLLLIIISLFIVGGVGLIIRQGIMWTKYLALTLLILYVIEAFSFLIHPEVNLTLQIIYGAQIILVTGATLNLFFNFQKKNMIA